MSKFYFGFMIIIATLISTFPHHAFSKNSPSEPPVYLYVDKDGGAYTFRTKRDWAGHVETISRNPVSEKEIESLTKLGFTISFVREPGLKVDSHSPKSVSIPELTSLPVSFSLTQWAGATYGGFYIQDTGGSGKNTHWFNTTLTSFYGSSFLSHLGIGLIADTDQLLTPHPPAMVPQLVANGIIIGNVSLNINGCGSPPNTTPVFNIEIESFWNGGNELYSSTCYPSGLSDNIDYLIDLHANRSGYVTYIIYPNGTGGWISPTASTAGDRPAGKPGTLSGNGFVVTLIAGPTPIGFVSFGFNHTYNGWF